MTATASLSVVAVAARTPVGLSAPASAAAVRAGIRRLGDHRFMLDARGEPLKMAVDARLDPKLTGARRLGALARSAIDEIAGQFRAGLLASAEVFLALPENRPGFSDRDAADTLASVNDQPGLERASVRLAGRGHAGAIEALSAASDRLRRGFAELCVVVGTDSYADADTIDWLEANRQLAHEGVRGGFIPGEAAGAIAVTTSQGHRGLRLAPVAHLRGVGTAAEPRRIKTELDVLGEGLHGAIGVAANGLGAPSEAIDEVYTDINGERYRTDEWGFALLRLGNLVRSSGYHAPSDCWGDVGAASAALGCVLAVRSWARGYASGPRALVWASSESGLRGAVMLESLPK